MTLYLVTYIVDVFHVKLATNIRHVTRHCRNGFQGQRSKAKVISVATNIHHVTRHCWSGHKVKIVLTAPAAVAVMFDNRSDILLRILTLNQLQM